MQKEIKKILNEIKNVEKAIQKLTEEKKKDEIQNLYQSRETNKRFDFADKKDVFITDNTQKHFEETYSKIKGKIKQLCDLEFEKSQDIKKENDYFLFNKVKTVVENNLEKIIQNLNSHQIDLYFEYLYNYKNEKIAELAKEYFFLEDLWNEEGYYKIEDFDSKEEQEIDIREDKEEILKYYFNEKLLDELVMEYEELYNEA